MLVFFPRRNLSFCNSFLLKVTIVKFHTADLDCSPFLCSKIASHSCVFSTFYGILRFKLVFKTALQPLALADFFSPSFFFFPIFAKSVGAGFGEVWILCCFHFHLSFFLLFCSCSILLFSECPIKNFVLEALKLLDNLIENYISDEVSLHEKLIMSTYFFFSFPRWWICPK